MRKNEVFWPLLIFFAVACLSLFSSCSADTSSSTDLNSSEEIVQQAADFFTSLDEMLLSGDAQASSRSTFCSQVEFDSCANNRRSKLLNGCTLRFVGTMDGLINLDYTPNANCSLSSDGHQVTRTPNFNLRGRRGLAFSFSGGSQVMTRLSSASYSFSSSGIRRKVQRGSTTLLDLTTSTDTPVLVQGSQDRATRQILAGSFVVINNLTNVSCEVNLQNLNWGEGCSCPNSGTTSVFCSDGATLNVTYTSACGTVTVTSDDGSTQIDLDRCY